MRLALVVFLALGLVAASCSDRDDSSATPSPLATPGATPTPLPAAASVLAAMRDALKVVAGYKVQVTAANFPLPGWGGIDSGFVTIGRDGTTAFADLVRTGDGGYSVLVDHDQVYFRRDSCEVWKHLPDATANVLAPFAFNANDTFAAANATKIEGRGDKQVVITVRTETLGVVEITVNTKTNLPTRIFRNPASGQEPLELLFTDWGRGPAFRTPTGAPDATPGPNLRC